MKAYDPKTDTYLENPNIVRNIGVTCSYREMADGTFEFFGFRGWVKIPSTSRGLQYALAGKDR